MLKLRVILSLCVVTMFIGCALLKPFENKKESMLILSGEEGQSFIGTIKSGRNSMKVEGAVPMKYVFDNATIECEFIKGNEPGTIVFKIQDKNTDLEIGSLYNPGEEIRFQYSNK